jgi:hypothetical protein
MRKFALLTIILIVLAAFSFFSVVFASVSVGVEKGNWIEYQVTVTGNPPPEYNITWARMDITGVQDYAINVSVQTLFGNGTLLLEPYVPLNVATGAIGDGFFVPLYLKQGDIYHTEYEGNITVTGIQRIEAGGAQRTVLCGVTNQTTYYWDKQTGIMVAATSNLPGCTMYTKTSITNIWQPQIMGVDQSLFYVLIIVFVGFLAAIVTVAIYFLRRKKG